MTTIEDGLGDDEGDDGDELTARDSGSRRPRQTAEREAIHDRPQRRAIGKSPRGRRRSA